jgi:phenylalanyl-tRNA synthetase alpha chain
MQLTLALPCRASHAAASRLMHQELRVLRMPPKKKSGYAVPKLKDFSAKTLKKESDKLFSAFDEEVKAVRGEAASKIFRDRWIARTSGILAQINDSWLKAAPKEAKRDAGQTVNAIRKWVEDEVAKSELLQIRLVDGIPLKRAKEAGSVTSASLSPRDQVDITLPGNRRPLGAEHPVIKTMNEIVGVFRDLGYSVELGPEIETDYYNFEALNFPPNHPARDTQDTLFIAGQESKPLRDRLLLRTHTSPVQIRTMQKMKPPLRVVCPGKVHRNDAPDATHSPIFHQVEGLAVDTNITFCDLKGTLDHAMKALFGSSVKTRFYPSFFPFTEPSADVQISCIFCGGKGYRDGSRCPNCKASGWIELLGCGMVDPNVYGFVDYDPKKVSGFAFGMGVERIAILKYGVDDIQLFFNGDVRFLEQFG